MTNADVIEGLRRRFLDLGDVAAWPLLVAQRKRMGLTVFGSVEVDAIAEEIVAMTDPKGGDWWFYLIVRDQKLVEGFDAKDHREFRGMFGTYEATIKGWFRDRHRLPLISILPKISHPALATLNTSWHNCPVFAP